MRTLSANNIGSNGLVNTAAAPIDIKCSSSFDPARAVMKTTGVFAVLGFSRRRASMAGPSMPGIITSQRIRSGAHSAAVASASGTVCATYNVSAESKLSESATISRISESSSMWRIRNGIALFALAHVSAFTPWLIHVRIIVVTSAFATSFKTRTANMALTP